MQKELEIEDFSDDDEVAPFRYSITSYGADYPVDSLVKRTRSEAIYVPRFQRKYVWSYPQASRFIESFLLGLPVPGIFLARDEENNRLMVIDGQQRLLSLQYFYDELLPGDKVFRLKGVHEEYEGKTYSDLSESDKIRLDDSILHATVCKQDQPSQDQSSIFLVFERLNTGGTPLSAQEVRNCVYEGPLIQMLEKLNGNTNWRRLIGRESPRRKDEELILRFLALTYWWDEYSRPMKGFLNKFTAEFKDASEEKLEEFENQFISVINFISEHLGSRAFRPSSTVNAAVFDAVMLAIRARLESAPIANPSAASDVLADLFSDSAFEDAYRRSTADRPQLEERVSIAMDKFASLN